MRKRLIRTYVRLLRSPAAPAEVAGGLALGLFVALLPILGVQMPAAVAAAALVRRTTRLRPSPVAAAAGSWLNNPLTAVPLYALTYVAGLPLARALLPARAPAAAVATADVEMLAGWGGAAALETVVALVAGGVLLGIPVAAAGYFAALHLLTHRRARRAARRARRRARTAATRRPAARIGEPAAAR